MEAQLSELPAQVAKSLKLFVDEAKVAFGDDLISAVLFGSAAEGKLRSTSDVNVLLLLKRFEQSRVDSLREPLRLAHAAIQLNAMFLLEAELAAATEAFAVRFADMQSRHRVLHGSDPFDNLQMPRDALIRRLKQVLLNQQLRLRERYVLLSLREEQLALVIAEAAGPLRAAAASLLQLEGHPAASPRAALEQLVATFHDEKLDVLLKEMSIARELRQLEHGHAAASMMSLIALTQQLRERADRLA